jgi:predicted nucleotidyltransferase component of viral defense system
MLELEQIQSYYPENIRSFKKNILREYIQYKMLEIIYSSDYYSKLVFIGGTAIRILHSNRRFSEDLDFDNKGLKEKDFNRMADIIRDKLVLEGYRVSLKNKYNGAFRSYIKIHDMLYDFSLSPHKTENIDIRIDAESQNFNYPIVRSFLNKFDVITQIFAAPADILLAQKIFALFNRKRAMGRDFYDILFLLGKTSPDYNYLDEKLNINNKSVLKSRLIDLCDRTDLDKLSEDIKPLIFKPEDSIKVRSFKKYIDQMEF